MSLLEDAIALHQQGNALEAEPLYRQLLLKNPDNIDALHLLAIALIDQTQYAEAETLMQKAVQLHPSVVYLETLAEIQSMQGHFKDAVQTYTQVLQLIPDSAEAYVNMGLAHQEQALFDEALGFYQKALSINPQQTDALLNMSGIFIRQGEYEKAVAVLQQLITLAPQLVNIYANFGTLCYELGQFDEALKYFNYVIELDPNHVNAHWNRSHVWLKQGNFMKGWPDHEWRWFLNYAKPANVNKPDWDGSPKPESTIMVYAEGGYGDTFQFYRFLPWVKERCQKVIFYCQPGTTSLFQASSLCDDVIEQGNPLPHFDYKVPIMSLAYLAQTTLETIPQQVPYIQTDPSLISEWQTFFSQYPGPKIGLVWSGSVTNPDGYSRSFDVAEFEPLKQFKNVHFFSLQKGPTALNGQGLPEGPNIIDLNDKLTDFHQTAAAIENLDLVISVDTSVTHLAGALNRPVYLLLHYVSEWRWLHNRNDSPWYPSIQLFRQPTHSDWKSVMADVCEALEKDFL